MHPCIPLQNRFNLPLYLTQKLLLSNKPLPFPLELKRIEGVKKLLDNCCSSSKKFNEHIPKRDIFFLQLNKRIHQVKIPTFHKKMHGCMHAYIHVCEFNNVMCFPSIFNYNLSFSLFIVLSKLMHLHNDDDDDKNLLLA